MLKNKSIQLGKLEKDFKKVFFNLIKPFYFVIGDENTEVAYKVLDKVSNKHKEVLGVLKDNYEITFIFKKGTKNSKKKEILIESVKELKKAFRKIVGKVADKMISYSIKELWEELKLPENVLN
jgi:hypothetical protein